jgi:hypothetical protein
VGLAIAFWAKFRYIIGTMANVSKLKIVQYKRREISQKIARHREALAALEAQEREYEITERVLASLDAEAEPPDLASEPEPAPEPAVEPGKPEGIPTMPEMIFEALRDAKTKGVRGLEPKEMASYIAAKWWPAVPINAVGPIAWRMYSKDRLAKRQSRYFLLKSAEETAETHAAA